MTLRSALTTTGRACLTACGGYVEDKRDVKTSREHRVRAVKSSWIACSPSLRRRNRRCCKAGRQEVSAVNGRGRSELPRERRRSPMSPNKACGRGVLWRRPPNRASPGYDWVMRRVSWVLLIVLVWVAITAAGLVFWLGSAWLTGGPLGFTHHHQSRWLSLARAALVASFVGGIVYLGLPVWRRSRSRVRIKDELIDRTAEP